MENENYRKRLSFYREAVFYVDEGIQNLGFCYCELFFPFEWNLTFCLISFMIPLPSPVAESA